MANTAWTHPTHCTLSSLATVLSGISFMLILIATDVAPFHSMDNSRSRNLSGDNGGSTFAFNQREIDCTDNMCVKKDSSSEEPVWQQAAFYLIMIGMCVNGFTFIIQAFIFWPLAIKGKVVSIMLRFSQILDFCAGYGKFSGFMIYLAHSPKINMNYVERKRHDLFQLNSLPLGLGLFSFIVQMLCVLLYTLALDDGPPGGPTHRERIKEEKDQQLKMDAEKRETGLRRRSSYIPNPESTHGRVSADMGVAAP